MATSTTTTQAPEYVPEYDLSSLCRYMTKPALMTGILRDILRRHFTAAPYINDPKLRHLIWQKTETTNIMIESVYRWRPEITELRPAILIRRNSYINQPAGIGNRQQGQPVDEYGHPHFSTFWRGSHTLFCVAREGNQVESLASEVQQELTEFAPVLMQALSLQQLRVHEVGPCSIIEESQQNLAVPVTVSYATEERWKLVQQRPRLRLSLSLLCCC